MLGAAGLEDIGALFPSGDPALAGADSIELLREAWRRVREAGWELVNADVVLVGEEPRLAPHRDEMRARLAAALGVEPERVAVRATTTDGLGFTGRRRGARRAGGGAAAPMNLAVVTHAEHPELRGNAAEHLAGVHAARPGRRRRSGRASTRSIPTSSCGSSTRDAKETIGYACTLPVRWDGVPQPRGIDWAMSNGAAGEPTTLCAIVAGVVAGPPRPGPGRRRSSGGWSGSPPRTASTA